MAKRTKQTSKGASRKSRPRKGKQKPEQAAEPVDVERIDEAVRVWEAYARLRSIRRVAEELGVSKWRVSEVLGSDRNRMLAMIDEHMEALVAGWESQHEEAQAIMGELLALCRAMLAEIRRAAYEGRLTQIRDKMGYPMPVLDAVQFLVMTRLLDQVAKIGVQAQAISSAYRKGDTSLAKEITPGGGDSFETMSDAQLVSIIKAGGMKVPPILAQKIKQLEAQRQPQNQA